MIAVLLATTISAWTWSSPYASEVGHHSLSLESGKLTHSVRWTGGKTAENRTEVLPVSRIACATQDAEGTIHLYGAGRYGVIVRDSGRTSRDDAMELEFGSDDTASAKRVLGELEGAVPRVRAKFGACRNAVDLYHLAWRSPESAGARRVLAYTGTTPDLRGDYVLYTDGRTLFVDGAVTLLGSTQRWRDNLALSRIGCVGRSSTSITVNGQGTADIVTSFTGGTIDTQPWVELYTSDAVQQNRVWRALTSISPAFARGLKRCRRLPGFSGL